ncbi:MAG: hypothetical protein VXY34_07285 [Bdellovibrionota bacterium]|nr:hypothetical protein [Bdellovibrionota bacterium]
MILGRTLEETGLDALIRGFNLEDTGTDEPNLGFFFKLLILSPALAELTILAIVVATVAAIPRVTSDFLSFIKNVLSLIG